MTPGPGYGKGGTQPAVRHTPVVVRIKFRVLATAVGVIAALSACAAPRPEPPPPGRAVRPAAPVGRAVSPQPLESGPELIYNLGVEPPSLDPAAAQATASFVVLNALLEGLVRLGPDGVMPGMATDWTVSDDGLMFTFYLREAIWTTGDPVTAGDFVHAWERVLDPRVGAPYADQLYGIQGSREMHSISYINNPAFMAEWAAARRGFGARAVNGRTLEIKLATPDPYFLERLALPVFLPVHRETARANPAWAAGVESYSSNGPFRLREWSHGEQILLARNEAYHSAEKVKLKTVKLPMIGDPSAAVSMFAAQRLDINEIVPAAEVRSLLARGQAGVMPVPGIYYYALNTQRAPFDQVLVRRALAMAINRSELVAKATRGGERPAYAMIPPGILLPGGSGDFRLDGGDYFEDNAELAQKLLQAAGYPGGAGFPEFAIAINTQGPQGTAAKAIAEAVIEMWHTNLGLEGISISELGWPYRQTGGEPAGRNDVVPTGWVADLPAPDAMLSLWGAGGDVGAFGWVDEEYNQYMAAAATETDVDTVIQAMHQAEARLMSEMPMIPLFFYAAVYQQQPDVSGIYRSSSGLIDFTFADLN